jgi:hypothetical protein
VILHLHPRTVSPTMDELVTVRDGIAPQPFMGVRQASRTQFSVARFAGGCTFNDHAYTYLPADDSLWRDDVLRAVLELRQADAAAPHQPERPAHQQEPLL